MALFPFLSPAIFTISVYLPVLGCPWLWQFTVACFVQMCTCTWMTEGHCQSSIYKYRWSCNPRSWWDLGDVEEGVFSHVLKWRKPYRRERARRQDTKSGTGERKGFPRPKSAMLVFSLPERKGSILEIIRVWMIKIGMPSAHILVLEINLSGVRGGIGTSGPWWI